MVEIKVPVLPESITEATVVNINIAVGDEVTVGDLLFELETDKVVLEINSEEDGVVTDISANKDDTVQENTILAMIDDTIVTKTATKEAKTTTDEKVTKNITDNLAADASPSVRKVLREHDISTKNIHGTGKSGRILKQDVLKTLDNISTQNAIVGSRTEEKIKMSSIRKTIAQRLLNAKQQTAMLTTFNEVDMSTIISLRKKYQEQFINKHNIKLGFMSFFVKASTEALKQYPIVNAKIDADDIIYHGYVDISVAVSTDRGLVVPIIRDAHNLALHEIEEKITNLAEKAKDAKLELSEITGGTFTITNGGIFGSLMSTPIINQPQSAVLGMHSIVKRAVVIDDKIVIKPMMYLALSYDHRLIDGKDAVLFLGHIKQAIEDPTRLLMGL